jgi:hypothetical protein
MSSSSTRIPTDLYEQVLAGAVEAARRRPTLLNFLKVLLADDGLQDAIAREEATNRRAANFEQQQQDARLEQQNALAVVLGQLDGGGTPEVPQILSSLFDIDELRGIVEQHRDVARLSPTCLQTLPDGRIDWAARAEQIISHRAAELFRDEQPDRPRTLWDWAVPRLIRMCRVDDIDVRFVRNWAARDSEYSESDPRAAELDRLDQAGAHLRLLEEMRAEYLDQAELLFGSVRAPSPTPEEPPPVEQAPLLAEPPAPPTEPAGEHNRLSAEVPSAALGRDEWEARAIGYMAQHADSIKSLTDLWGLMRQRGYPGVRTSLYSMPTLLKAAVAAGIYSPKEKPEGIPTGFKTPDGRIEAEDPHEVG